MDTIATGLRELSLDKEELPLSVHTVVSNDDLLNEILLKLPVISLVLFKSVSKRWLSLIKDVAFIKRRSRIPNIDPPSGLFIKRYSDTNVGTYASVPFDIRIPSRVENIFKTVPHSGTTILQSCNGLFLCSVMPGYRFCVYNPTLSLFTMLPEPLDYVVTLCRLTSMDFDPTKSPHYKVMHATALSHDHRFQIQTYTSVTGIWSIVCDCTDPFEDLARHGIYWNDAIHWLTDDYDSFLHYKLEFGNKNAVLTKIKVPVIDAVELFESRGCLLLIGKDKNHSHQLNVYEMRNGHSEWSMKYSLDHSRITFGRVKCIALGEREEDSFMVLGGFRNCVYLYNIVLKTFRELPEFRSMLPKKNVVLRVFCSPHLLQVYDYAFLYQVVKMKIHAVGERDVSSMEFLTKETCCRARNSDNFSFLVIFIILVCLCMTFNWQQVV